jgi:ankyrin repeat protein
MEKVIYVIISFSLFLHLVASEQPLAVAEKKPSLEFLFSSQLQKDDKKTAKWLLKQGADPNIKRFSQSSLLHNVIEKSDNPETTFTFTQLLCKHNADVNIKNSSKETPLISAIKKNDEKTVELLLKQGAQPNIENDRGEYPIHIAMEWDTEQENHFYKKRKILPTIVILLLKHGADPNVRYHFKSATPLHAAVFHNEPTIVQALLYYGANKNICDDRGYTPLDLAKKYGYKKIAAILSHIVPYAPPAWLTIEEEIASFHYIEWIKKIPFIINTTQPFSNKTIIDDYVQSVDFRSS